MLYTTLIQLNKDFIAEAKKSPTLLSDMAAMERYMSESYSERLLIELIQNADDAKSSKIILLKDGNNIVFANNGRDFTEDDILAICRSGASSKQKGTSIGYRGIGFKSASYLADNITIVSAGTAFSFSKEKTAKALGVSTANVPTIRVPFLSDISDYLAIVSKLKLEGYTTLFIFKDANIDMLINEVSNLHKDVLLFLNNICEFNVSLEDKSFKYIVERQTRTDFVEIHLNNNIWGVFDNKLGIMMNNGKFVKCETKDALYSCFLPTYDTVAYPIKINADFPTDPSRKHIIVNDESKAQLDDIAHIIRKLVQKTLLTPSEEYSEILDIFSCRISFSVINQYLSTCLKNLFSNLHLTTNGGKTISISEYKTMPSDMESSLKKILREESPIIHKVALSNTHFNTLTNLSQFLCEFSTKQFSLEDIKNTLEDVGFVRKLSVVAYTNLMKYCCDHYSVAKYVHSTRVDFSHIYVNTGEGVQTLKDGHCRLLDMLVNEGNVSKNTAIQFLTDNGMDISWADAKETGNMDINLVEKNALTPIKEALTVPRWRSAENICIDIESSNGNKAEDVSRKNLGYDVLSITPTGEHRYIEVKAISKLSGEFSITNNEYTTAHQYGDKYILCLILQGIDSVEIIYIPNPIKSLSFEKRIRQWDWLCSKYDGDHITIQYT